MIRVVRQYLNFRSTLFFLTEGFLIFTSVGVAILLRFLFNKNLILNDPLVFWKALIFAGICQLCFSYSDLYTFKNGRYMQKLLSRLLQAIGVAALLIVVVSYLFPSFLIGRGIFLISLMICPGLILSWRYFYATMLDKTLLSEKIMIIGTGSLAKEIGSEILSNRSLGYHIVGFIDEDPTKVGERVLNPSIIGDYGQISQIVGERNISQIVVALTERRGTLPVDELLRCKMAGVLVEEGITFYEKITGKVSVEELKPSWLIYSDGFNIQKYKKLVKRGLDIILSVAGLIVSAPLLLLIALLIWLDSPGPVFYRQERVGENEKIFTLLKFRSMKVDAEKNSGPIWAKDNDPRVTRIGQLIRKTRIDEIPQLINVIKGEMSFVGPRPERPVFVESLKKEIPYYRLRSSVKPGVTGWAQVKFHYGASEKDSREKLKYDLYYIKNLSVFLDIAILISTVKVVLSGRGAR